MSEGYVWYKKPGWWVFLIVAVGFMLMIATAPRLPDKEFSTEQRVFSNVRCYISPDTESQMLCDNPTYYNRPTPKTPK